MAEKRTQFTVDMAWQYYKTAREVRMWDLKYV